MANKNKNKSKVVNKVNNKVETPVVEQPEVVETPVAEEVKAPAKEGKKKVNAEETGNKTPKIVATVSKSDISLDTLTSKMVGKDSAKLSPDARVQLAALTDSRIQRGLIPEELSKSLNYFVNVTICFETIRAYAQITEEGKEMGLLMNNKTAEVFAKELFDTFGITTKLLPAADGQTKLNFNEVPEEILVPAKKETKMAQQTTIPEISVDMTEEEKTKNILSALAKKHAKSESMSAMAANFMDAIERVERGYNITDRKEAMAFLVKKFTVFMANPKGNGNKLNPNKSSLLINCFASMVSGSLYSNNELFTIFATLRKDHFAESVLSNEELAYFISLMISQKAETQAQEDGLSFTAMWPVKYYDILVNKHDVMIEKLTELFAKTNDELNNQVDIHFDEKFKVSIMPLKLKCALAEKCGIDLSGGDAVDALIAKMKSIAGLFNTPLARLDDIKTLEVPHVEEIKTEDASTEETPKGEESKEEPAKEEKADETK